MAMIDHNDPDDLERILKWASTRAPSRGSGRPHILIVTESVFSIPGLGRLTVEAVLARDFPVIQTVILMFSFVYVLINLLVDLVYSVLDPRIRY